MFNELSFVLRRKLAEHGRLRAVFGSEDANGARTDSKPVVGDSTSPTPAISRGTGINCLACGKQLDESTNDEQCMESPYWHRRHTFYVLHGVCCE